MLKLLNLSREYITRVVDIDLVFNLIHLLLSEYFAAVSLPCTESLIQLLNLASVLFVTSFKVMDHFLLLCRLGPSLHL